MILARSSQQYIKGNSSASSDSRLTQIIRLWPDRRREPAGTVDSLSVIEVNDGTFQIRRKFKVNPPNFHQRIAKFKIDPTNFIKELQMTQHH